MSPQRACETHLQNLFLIGSGGIERSATAGLLIALAKSPLCYQRVENDCWFGERLSSAGIWLNTRRGKSTISRVRPPRLIGQSRSENERRTYIATMEHYHK